MKKRNKILKILLFFTSLTAAVLLVALYVGKFYIESKVEKKLDRKIASLRNVAKISYGDVDLDVWKRKLIISDIDVLPAEANSSVKIDKIVVNSFDAKNKIPTYGDFFIKGIKLPVSAFSDEGKIILQSLGYIKDFDIDMHISYFYDNSTGEFNLKDFSQSVPGFGDIKISLDVGNFFTNRGTFYLLLFGWRDILFRKGELIFKDRGLTQKLLRFLSKEENISEEEVKRKVIAKLERRLETNDNPHIKMTIVALKNFIEKPDLIYIKASPSNPVSLGKVLSIKKNEDIVSIFNLRIEAR